MTANDLTPRVFAGGSALVGLVTVMLQSSPSVEGILIGLWSIVLWAGFSLAPSPKRPPVRSRAQNRPPPPQAPGPTLVLRSQPHPLLPKPVQSSSKLPEIPTHRQRISDRRTSGRR